MTKYEGIISDIFLYPGFDKGLQPKEKLNYTQ